MAEEREQFHQRNPEALLLLVAIIWGINAPLVKFGLSGLDGFIFNSIRFLVAPLLVGALFFSRSTWRPIRAGDWYPLIRIGIVAHVMYQLVYVFAMSKTTAGNVAVLASTSPLWTMFINAKVRHERVPQNAVAGSIISLAGIVLMIVGSGQKLEFGNEGITGDVLAVCSAILWALYTVLQKPVLERYSSMQLMFVTIGIGGIGLTLAAIPRAFTVQWSAVEPIFWLVPLVSGALSIGLANILWSNGIRHIGPRKTMNYSNLIPVIAFTASAIFLKEPVTPYHFGGAALTVGGVWLARR